MQRRYLRHFAGQKAKDGSQAGAPAAGAAPAQAAPGFEARFHSDRYSAGDVAGWATDPAEVDRFLDHASIAAATARHGEGRR